jgi:hypothetical protein
MVKADMTKIRSHRRTSPLALGSFCLVTGAVAASCGSSTGNDNRTDQGDPVATVNDTEGLIKTTSVHVDADGNKVVSTTLITPQQMQSMINFRKQALEDRKAGIETAAITNDTSCNGGDTRAVWVWDGPNQSGNMCCITGWGTATFGAQLGCGFDNVQTVWTGEVGGYVYGGCSQWAAPDSWYGSMPCNNVNTIWLATCDSNRQCGDSWLVCHYGQCVSALWPSPSTYDSMTLGANPGGPVGGTGEWQVSWTSPTRGFPPYSDAMQGVAHDATSWYMIREKEIYVVPLNADMNQYGDWLVDHPSATDGSVWLNGGWSKWGSSVGSFHFGDGDFYGGHLFVPVETTTGTNYGQFVAIFNPAPDCWHSMGTAVTPQQMPLQSSFAWLAVNPQDGILYTATTFNNVSWLQTYTIGGSNGLTLSPSKTVQLRYMDGTGITLPNNVQGGAFSPNGHLYISVGSLDGMYGIWAFDTDGTLYGRYWGQHSPTFRYPFTYADDEVEGMDIVDMSTHPGAGMNGQIHMVKMKQHGWTHNDGLVFYHWNINSPYY